MKTTTGPIVVDVPIKDVDARSLRLKLNEVETEPVLASSHLSSTTTAGDQLILRMDVIGASHVVTLQRESGRAPGATVFREELSCSPHGRGLEVADGLDYGTQSSGWDYQVSVVSRTVERDEFLETARRLEDQKGEGWLVARFPGEGEGHITALSATIDISRQAPEVSWCTWHLYAEQTVVVRSYSRARLVAE